MPTTETTFAGEMLIRELDTDKREFTGIAVPWGDEVEIFGLWRESFDPGAVQDSDSAKVFYRHGEAIGKIISHRDTPEGWEVTGTISATTTGDEAYTLLRDGVIDRLSVGFEPLEHRVTEDGTIVHTKVKVREVSLVPFPAYDNAKVSQVRHAEPIPTKETAPMTDTLTRDELDAALTEQNEVQERALEARLASFTPTPAAPSIQYRSFGEFVKAYAAGDAEAVEFQRAYTGGQMSDDVTRNTWVADAIRLIEKRRKVLDAFTKEPLPASGMTLEYAKLKSNTTAVAKQAKEGDTLATGKVTLESKTTPVGTYGGYTTLSRQIIERANAGYTTTAFKAMAIEYANATEAAVRATLAAAIAAEIAAGNKLGLAANATAYDWVDLLIDAAEKYDDNGYNLEGAYVSKDVFKRLIRLEDTNGNSLMRFEGDGVNRVGFVDVKGISATLANVPFKLLPGAAAKTLSFYDPVAITSWESAGAPLRLEDQDVTNLTNSYSVYGYLASASQFPDALLPVELAA